MIGGVDSLSRTLISGWAADPARPQDAVAVCITVDGRPTYVVADAMRPTLCRAFPDATGRYGFRLDAALLPLSPFVEHQVDIIFAETGKPLPRGCRRIAPVGLAAATPREVDGRTPVVVTSTGRSGTSLLMARLAGHAGILVAQEHPYELKLLSYYGLALRTLVMEADTERSSHPDAMVTPEQRFHIGFNPYNAPRDARDPVLHDYWNRTAPDILRASFARLIDEYYSCVARSTGKPQAGLFAEKIGTVDLVREAAAFMFGGAREILVVRDPRDVICSSRAFWGGSFADVVSSLQGQFAGLSQPRTEPGLRQHVVRYEDLLLRPCDTMSGLLAFLDLPATELAPDAQAEAQVFRRHATTASPEQTIGRWRHDLTQPQAAIANAELRPFFERFGYAAD